MISVDQIERVARAAWRAAVGEVDAEPAGHPVYEAVKAELMPALPEKIEYPKYVGDTVVHSAEEEAALSAPAEVEQPAEDAAPEPLAVVEPEAVVPVEPATLAPEAMHEDGA